MKEIALIIPFYHIHRHIHQTIKKFYFIVLELSDGTNLQNVELKLHHT